MATHRTRTRTDGKKGQHRLKYHHDRSGHEATISRSFVPTRVACQSIELCLMFAYIGMGGHQSCGHPGVTMQHDKWVGIPFTALSIFGNHMQNTAIISSTM